MGKPSLKFIVTINLINNIPMAIVMSVSAPLLAGEPLVVPGLMLNIIAAFIMACIIAIALPVQKMANGIPAALKLDPNSLIGRIIGNIPICAIFVLIIGLCLTFINVQIMSGAPFPAFIFAFLSTALPLYLICFVVSMITNPIAIKTAIAGEKARV